MTLPAIVDPEWLVKQCDELRQKTLFCDEDEGPIAYATPEAEQYMLLAIGALEQAQRFAQLASYKLARRE